jgi:glutamine amidotransferase
MIVIVDYGMGNLGSIVNMFRKIGVHVEVANSPDQLFGATKLILPGVGSFDQAMNRINNSGFREVMDSKVLVDKVPVMGICLGMQLLTRGSEEGDLPGLGWIAADTIRFPNQNGLKVPHMGWNIVQSASPSPITVNLHDNSRFYFVHSYRVHVDNEEDSILKCTYGIQFDAAIQHGSIFGAQFHPEKSHKFGMRFLENFARI